ADFGLPPANVGAVAALAVHLDGLPLALELAAARANVLAPREMLDWAGARLPALRGGAADLPERHRSLRAALDWSYDLLRPAEQTAFRRAAVFAGGRSRAAPEAVGDVRGLDAVEALSRLV